jgi:MFS family permease
MLQPNEQTVERSYAGSAEEEAMRPARSRTLLPVLLFIAGMGVGCAGLFYKNNSVELWQLTAFLVLGLVYATSVQPRSLSSGATFRTAFFFALAFMVITALASYFVKTPAFGMAFLFAGAFLLPCTVAESWRLFRLVVVGPKPVWRYAKETPDEAPFVYLEKKPFRILVFSGDEIPEEYDAVVPSSLPLGLAFFYTVKHERSPEEWRPYFLDKDGRPYAWQFYEKKTGFWKSYLQPNETVSENNIGTRSVIVAERLNNPHENE